MPLERLQKLFETIGETAQQLAEAKTAGGAVVHGGRVAHSERVSNISDIYKQLGAAIRPVSAIATPQPAPIPAVLLATLKRLADALEASDKQRKTKDKESEGKPPRGGQATTPRIIPLPQWSQRLTPDFWLKGLAQFSKHVEAQERAGKAVTTFTLALAAASRALYSFATGNIITASGRSLPWSRAMALKMRKTPGIRIIRRALLAPHIMMRRLRRTVISATHPQGKRSRTIRESAGGIAPVLQQSIGKNATVTPRDKPQAAGAVGTIAAQIAGRAAVAGAGATAGGGTAGAAAAGGASLVAAAGPVGVALAAAAAVVGLFLAAIAALRRFTVAVKDAAESLLQSKFSKLGGVSGLISAQQARLEAYDIGSRLKEARETGYLTQQLTYALIQLRREMGPLNRSLENVKLALMVALVQLARAVNQVLHILVPLLPLLEMISRTLAKQETPMPIGDFLSELERAGHWRNPPPQGGFPPWH